MFLSFKHLRSSWKIKGVLIYTILVFTAMALALAPARAFFKPVVTAITGIVTDPEGTPLPAATITLKNSSYVTVTDNDGRFILENVRPGKYLLEVTFIGYKTIEHAVELKEGQVINIPFTLEEDHTLLQSVEVTGKTETSELRQQAFNITAIDTKKLLNNSSDLNQILNRTTGIRIRETGGMGSSFNFSINGFSGNQVKFFLDGIPMTNFGSSMTLNNLPVNMADRIEVYKGVVPIWLGSDALGGAVNIVTNKRYSNYFDASYSFGSFNSHRLSINGAFTGKKGFTINTMLFGNYSDNNYPVDVSVADRNTGVFQAERKYRHFHDAYTSGGVVLEAGLVNKKYADRLLLGIMVSGNENEVQQGSNMQRVVGQAYSTSQSVMPNIKYSKENFLISNLAVNVVASYNITENVSVDTSSRVYDWTGTYTYRNFGQNENRGELGEKMHYIFDERDFLTTLNVAYKIAPAQALNFNATTSRYNRREKELIRPDRLGLTNPALDKSTFGLSYRVNLFDNKISATAFAKLFYLKTEMPTETEIINSSIDQHGFGVAGTYFIKPTLQIKTSYEDTYRLPESSEMLGDGLNVIKNPYLRPEHSRNINLGIAYSKYSQKNVFTSELGLIYRKAGDFIRSKADGPRVMYENMRSVRVAGAEASFSYNYHEKINFSINATYQDIINTNKYEPPGTKMVSFVYKLRIPNTPYLFGNADVDLLFKNVFSNDDNLSVNLGASYVEAFYLFWPTLGDPVYKKDIPRQITGNAGVTYSFLKGKYNVSLDCRNITNTKVYDYFNVQKPGRALSIKLRYFLIKRER